MSNVAGRIRELWEQMGASQRLIFLALSGSILVTLLLFFAWIGKEDYTQLYANLSHEDSARVIEILQKQGVDYQVSDGGTGIRVPVRMAGEMKAVMAQAGVPTGGSVGYEIFDKQGLGVSEFTQSLNYRRALEGELARSLATLEGIDKARVHLVLPKQAVFAEDRIDPSASVVLDLAGRRSMERGQVAAVQRLVANGVEGLSADLVTVLDGYGNLLSRDAGDELGGMSNAQMETEQRVESYLARKAQGTLEGVLGQGKAIVRVNADLDFEKVERTREVVDPEASAILSEIRSQTQNEETGESVENSTVNYEFNRMVESIVGTVGGIKHLSVAVLIDGSYQQEAGGEAVYVPRKQKELEGYRKIVENIVGIDAERGDRIEIMNVQFTKDLFPAEAPGIFASPWMKKLPNALNRIVFFAVLIFLIISLKGVGGKMADGLSRLPERGDNEGGDNSPAPVPSEEGIPFTEAAQRQLFMEEQAKALAAEKPEEIAQLVKTWIHSKG